MKHISHGIVFAPDEGGSGGSGGGSEDGGDENEDNDDDDDDAGDDVEALRKENARLKAEANKARTKAAREAKAARDRERKAARESDDSEEVKKALAEAEKRAADAELKANRAQARSLAAEAGAKNPSLVVKLIDFDDLTDPSDEDEVRDAIEALIKENPYLKARATRTDGGEGGKGNKEVSTDINAALRRATGR